MRNKITYFSLLIFLFAILIIAELNKPRRIDWRLSFSADSKAPYGCYVLRNILDNDEQFLVRDNLKSFYYSFSDTTRINENLIVITENFLPDESDLEKLMDYVDQGNTAFISALNFSEDFFDTLKLKSEIPFELFSSKKKNKQHHFNFVNPHLAAKKMFHYEKINSAVYFTEIDTSKSVVLAKDSHDKVHFLKIPYGKGFFYIHTIPQIFSNYLILYDNKDFPVKTLSYFTSKKIIWDEYYKPSGSRSSNSNRSPLRYILSQESLKSAYYLLIFTVFLFMVFEGKRKQTIIPVYNRPKNTSKEFVEIISRLYLNRKDNKNLAEKKILHFYDFINSTYYLKPDENDEKFQWQLVEKTGLTHEKVKHLCNSIRKIKSQKFISDHDLIKFVNLLNTVQYAQK